MESQPHFTFEKMHLVLFLDFKVVELVESVEVLAHLFSFVISSTDYGKMEKKAWDICSLFLLPCSWDRVDRDGVLEAGTILSFQYQRELGLRTCWSSSLEIDSHSSLRRCKVNSQSPKSI